MANERSEHPVAVQFEELKQLVAECEPDVDKCVRGQRAAGVRIRSHLTRVKEKAHQLRKTIIEVRPGD
jgi:hypothetical protein